MWLPKKFKLHVIHIIFLLNRAALKGLFFLASCLAGFKFPNQGSNLGPHSETPSPKHWTVREFPKIKF